MTKAEKMAEEWCDETFGKFFTVSSRDGSVIEAAEQLIAEVAERDREENWPIIRNKLREFRVDDFTMEMIKTAIKIHRWWEAEEDN